jgi:DNA-binding CsgD family transcriptional regulator
MNILEIDNTNIEAVLHQSASFAQDVQNRLKTLTERERRLMELVIAGMPNKRIAAVLGIGQRTVDRVRAKVFEKMNADSAVELAKMIVKSHKSELKKAQYFDGDKIGSDIPKHVLDLWQRDRQSIANGMHQGLIQCLNQSVENLEQFNRLSTEKNEDANMAFDKALSLLKHSIDEVQALIRELQLNVNYDGECTDDFEELHPDISTQLS